MLFDNCIFNTFFKIILRFVFNQKTNLRDILSKAKLLLRNRNQKGNQKEVNIKSNSTFIMLFMIENVYIEIYSLVTRKNRDESK